MKKILSCLLIIACCASSTLIKAQAKFVKVNGQQFTINKKPYYFIGANYWYGGLLALEKDPKRGKERIRKELDFLKANGVNNLRILAGSEGVGLVNGVERVKPSFQPEHGKYNTSILDGLDFLLYEMGKRKMYAVLYLSNNWEWSGGFLQFLNWNNQLSTAEMQSKMSWDKLRDNTSKFYSCQPCKDDYLKQAEAIINHYNPYTKRSYINEPAIMAWELANEPRPMRPAANNDYKTWADAVAKRIKELDKNHLVTLGTEGEMGVESMALFKEIHAPKEIDYLTLHVWPKNWGWFRDTSIVKDLPSIISKTQDYIRKHEIVAEALKKPLVLEEFGLPRDRHSFNPSTSTGSRDAYYNSVFEEWMRSRKANGSIAGCNIWSFGGTAIPKTGQLFWKEGDDFMGDPPQEEQGLNSVFSSDASTWKIIKSYNKPLKK